MARPSGKSATEHLPQRIKGKLEECEFFLKQMGQSHDPQEFGYHLSAFLCAFGTFTELRLRQKYNRECDQHQALRQLRKQCHDLDVLRKYDLRNVEVHREGIRIWIYRRSRPEQTTSKPAVSSRYPSRYGSGTRVTLERITAAPDTHAGCSFIFHDSGGDVVKTCRAALDVVRSLGE